MTIADRVWQRDRSKFNGWVIVYEKHNPWMSSHGFPLLKHRCLVLGNNIQPLIWKTVTHMRYLLQPNTIKKHTATKHWSMSGKIELRDRCIHWFLDGSAKVITDFTPCALRRNCKNHSEIFLQCSFIFPIFSMTLGVPVLYVTSLLPERTQGKNTSWKDTYSHCVCIHIISLFHFHFQRIKLAYIFTWLFIEWRGQTWLTWRNWRKYQLMSNQWNRHLDNIGLVHRTPISKSPCWIRRTYLLPDSTWSSSSFFIHARPIKPDNSFF